MSSSVDPSGLEGAVAVVTGGAGSGAGLGAGLARRFADAGMRVVVLDVDAERAAETASVLRARGTGAISYAADVTDADALRDAAAHVMTTFGACNVLCAHAGGGGGGGPVESLSIENWRRTFEVNVFGALNTVNAFLPLMRSTAGFRRIVITSSASALFPGTQLGPYRAAKAAVTSLGETLGHELGPEGIGTTVVFPSGMVPPDAIESARAMLGTTAPDDPAAAVVRQFATDPTDLATGEEAAEHVVEAILNSEPYLITHGVTVGEGYERRHQQLTAALARSRSRRRSSTDAS